MKKLYEILQKRENESSSTQKLYFKRLSTFDKEWKKAENSKYPDDLEDLKRDYFQGYADHIFMINKCVWTDHTTESAYEDENTYAETMDKEDMYDMMLECMERSLREDIAKRIPIDVLTKFAINDEAEGLKIVEKQKVIRKISFSE